MIVDKPAAIRKAMTLLDKHHELVVETDLLRYDIRDVGWSASSTIRIVASNEGPVLAEIAGPDMEWRVDLSASRLCLRVLNHADSRSTIRIPLEDIRRIYVPRISLFDSEEVA